MVGTEDLLFYDYGGGHGEVIVVRCELASMAYNDQKLCDPNAAMTKVFRYGSFV